MRQGLGRREFKLLGEVHHTGAVKHFSAQRTPACPPIPTKPLRRTPMLPLLIAMGALVFAVIGYALLSPDQVRGGAGDESMKN